jgi:hypothetical protein
VQGGGWRAEGGGFRVADVTTKVKNSNLQFGVKISQTYCDKVIETTELKSLFSLL